MAALVDILPSSWLASFLNLSVGILSLQVTLNRWGCGFHSQPSEDIAGFPFLPSIWASPQTLQGGPWQAADPSLPLSLFLCLLKLEV